MRFFLLENLNVLIDLSFLHKQHNSIVLGDEKSSYAIGESGTPISAFHWTWVVVVAVILCRSLLTALAKRVRLAPKHVCSSVSDTIMIGRQTLEKDSVT